MVAHEVENMSDMRIRYIGTKVVLLETNNIVLYYSRNDVSLREQ